MCIQPRWTGCFRIPFKGKLEQKYVLQVRDTWLWALTECKTRLQSSSVLVACSNNRKVISPVLKWVSAYREYLLCRYKWNKLDMKLQLRHFEELEAAFTKYLLLKVVDNWALYSDELNISWTGSDWFEINSITCSEDHLIFSLSRQYAEVIQSLSDQMCSKTSCFC